jgi:DNA replication protein DnaC
MEINNNDIIKKLKEMRLPVMASEYQKQIEDVQYLNYSFQERFSMLLNSEYDSRVNHTIERNRKKATLYDSTANINEINYRADRKINRSLIETLQTNEYIDDGLNVILIGASGCGKTWISNALGMNAILDRRTVKYIRLSELFSEFEAKKIQNTYRQYIKQINKFDLLILDDFLLVRTNESERNDLLELMEKRTNKKSTIFCSQWSPEGWHEKLGNGPIADAILDRIVNSSYTMFIEGKSMREEYSKLK